MLPNRIKLPKYSVFDSTLIQTNNKLFIIDAVIMQRRQIDMITPQLPALAYHELHQD